MEILGKGFYIWQIKRCEQGNVWQIADLAQQAGLSHILVKIADGTHAYNLDLATGRDLVPPLIAALRNKGINVFGWHYVYGNDPVNEASIAIHRVQELGLEGYVIDAESQYEPQGKDKAAGRFMDLLRKSIPGVLIALSSFRFPTVHPRLPWKQFIDQCDVNMPQVYWEKSHNPAEQLARCIREFEGISPSLPLIPTGSAYYHRSWQPNEGEITEFLDTAQDMGLKAANFWEWGHTRKYLPDLWEVIAQYTWNGATVVQDFNQLYIQALNSLLPEKISAMYHSSAAFVTSDRTLVGRQSIAEWYREFFSQTIPGGVFALLDTSNSSGPRTLNWNAITKSGKSIMGENYFGLANQKIHYHFLQIKDN